MLCQKCHKSTATVRYAEVVDGKVADLHLCADCLNKHQNQADKGFELSGPRALPVVTSSRVVLEPLGRSEFQTCSVCETSLANVLKTGRVGCVTCYESFGTQMAAVLEGIHGAAIHRGKQPRMDDARERVRANLQTKRALLRSALGAENYEEAAGLRDDIRVLESGLRTSELGHE